MPVAFAEKSSVVPPDFDAPPSVVGIGGFDGFCADTAASSAAAAALSDAVFCASRSEASSGDSAVAGCALPPAIVVVGNGVAVAAVAAAVAVAVAVAVVDGEAGAGGAACATTGGNSDESPRLASRSTAVASVSSVSVSVSVDVAAVSVLTAQSAVRPRLAVGSVAAAAGNAAAVDNVVPCSNEPMSAMNPVGPVGVAAAAAAVATLPPASVAVVEGVAVEEVGMLIMVDLQAFGLRAAIPAARSSVSR